jgi:hypothetical protein
MNSRLIFLIISFLNLLFVVIYGYALELPVIFSQFPEIGTSSCLNYFYGCYLPDIYIYLRIIVENKPGLILDQFSKGLTAFHIYPYLWVNDDYVIYTSFIINSIIIGYTFSLYKRFKILKIYLLFSPYFIYYSYGMTKEILLTCSLIIILCGNSFVKIKNKYLIGIPLLLISRPQFIPFIFSLYFIKSRMYSYILLILYFLSPLFLIILGQDYLISGENQ